MAEPMSTVQRVAELVVMVFGAAGLSSIILYLLDRGNKNRISSAQAAEAEANALKAKAEAMKIEAEANEQVRDTVMKVLEPYKARVECLENEVTDLRSLLKKYAAGIKVLVTQIRSFGQEPAWLPEEEEEAHAQR